MRRITPLIVVGVLAVALPSHATQNVCVARKEQCVSKRTAATLKCHERAEKRGVDPVADPATQACLQKAQSSFDGGAVPSKGCFAKLESKYAGACLTTGDTATVASDVDDYVEGAVTALDPGYPAAVKNACSAAKKKCVSKLAAGRLTCHAKHNKTTVDEVTNLSICLQRARDRFDGHDVPGEGCFGQAEAKFAGTCLTTGDTAALRDQALAFVADVVCALDNATCPTPTATPTPPPSFACCGLPNGSCADIPPAPAGDCALGGGGIFPGYVCLPGGCGPPPPTPTPTP
jgi:hypothetical protein